MARISLYRRSVSRQRDTAKSFHFPPAGSSLAGTVIDHAGPAEPAAPPIPPTPARRADDFRRPGGLGLGRRIALITAVISVMLVLVATEATLTWSEQSRLADLREETVALARSWAAFLSEEVPAGDPAQLASTLNDWPTQHITETEGRAFLVHDGRLVSAGTSDSSISQVPDSGDIAAYRTRTLQAWRTGGAHAAWFVALPIGPARHPYGVFDVQVSTRRLGVWARAERRRAYPIALLTGLVLAGVLGFLTNRWVGRPLTALGDAMSQAHGGAGAAPPAPELGAMEFRLLARRYNQLRDALATRERESAARGALLTLEERARGYDRLALMEETAAGFAHEIGTPLNTVSGHLQLLRDDLERLPERAPIERVRLVLGQIDRVAGIVRTWLERGAWPAPTPQVCDLRQIVLRMLRFLEPALLQAGVAAEFAPAPGVLGRQPVPARCDPEMVEQILLNLLKNAIEALAPGDRIVLTTGLTGAAAWIEVSDTGPGLTPEARLRLFNPFASTKRGGTGLGLAVSRRLARSLGGDLEHIPQELGTAWRLSLPPAKGAA